MAICSNCFRDISEGSLFCSFCGWPTGNIGLKQCGKKHIIYEEWKACPFCSNMENLGKSFINPGRESTNTTRPTKPVDTGKLAKSMEILNDKTVLESEDEIDDKTVLESEADMVIDDKTRVETLNGYESRLPDKTVLETEPGEDKTILDEGIEESAQMPLVFAWLVFLDEEEKPIHDVRLTRQKNIIGKGTDADIIIKNSFASKLHALIYLEEGIFFISDMGSTNHTWLNEEKVMKEKLTDGDRLRIGHQQMIFKAVRRCL